MNKKNIAPEIPSTERGGTATKVIPKLKLSAIVVLYP